MKKNAHTPGPWEWRKATHVYPETYLIAADSSQVMSVYESHGGGHMPDAADKHLIAAAPELLAGLREAFAAIEELLDSTKVAPHQRAGSTTVGNIRAELKAIIARAEGREP